jgi:hypothetical protein
MIGKKTYSRGYYKKKTNNFLVDENPDLENAIRKQFPFCYNYSVFNKET